MSDSHKKDFLPAAMIFCGLLLLVTNLFTCKHERFYLGESLATQTAIISSSPEIAGSRKNRHYEFKVQEFKCELWLSEGAFDVIDNREYLKNELTKIHTGDTVVIGIRQSDVEYLQNELQHIRVISLKKSNSILLTHEDVQKEDKTTYSWSLVIGIVALLIGVIMAIRQYQRRREQVADEL